MTLFDVNIRIVNGDHADHKVVRIAADTGLEAMHQAMREHEGLGTVSGHGATPVYVPPEERVPDAPKRRGRPPKVKWEAAGEATEFDKAE